MKNCIRVIVLSHIWFDYITMILSSCHHYSLNNDCHCHYMQRIYVYFIMSCLDFTSLALFCLVLTWCELTSITTAIIGMTLYELVSHYITISYHIISDVFLFYLFCWFDFHSILFYSILLHFISNRFDLIWFDSTLFYIIEFDLLYCSVLYLISMNDLCLSIYPSDSLSVCLFVYLYE